MLLYIICYYRLYVIIDYMLLYIIFYYISDVIIYHMLLYIICYIYTYYKTAYG